MPERRNGIVAWTARWGFAVLVGLGAIGAIGVASATQPPAEVPSFALQAEAVYRLEVGAAVFAAVYLAAMALVLALHNRAFSEIGMSGFKAQDVSGEIHAEAIRRQQAELESVLQMVAEVRDKPERDAGEAATMNLDDNQ